MRKIFAFLGWRLKKMLPFFGVVALFVLGGAPLLATPEETDLREGAPLLVKHAVSDENDNYINLKRQKRHYDDQVHRLTRDSDYVTGEECARVGWVKNLDSYYSSKTPSKVVRVPADIHVILQRLGNSIKGCSAYNEVEDCFPENHRRNILVPHVSYIIDDGQKRSFIKGDFITVPTTNRRQSRPLFFTSGSKDWKLNQSYEAYRKALYLSGEKALPRMQAMGGQYAGKLTGKDFKRDTYELHTEEFFHEIINTFPSSMMDPLEKKRKKPKKLYALVIDMYSIWDVCEKCQKRFKQEFFKRSILKKIEKSIEEKGIRLPRHGLKVVYRVSSQQAYGEKAITDNLISQAGGGCDPGKGYDIKAIDTAQVTLSTRIPRQAPLKWVEAFYDVREKHEWMCM